MRKAKRKHIFILFLLALLVSGGQFLYAETDQVLLAFRITDADEQQLREMVRMRDLQESDAESMRASLLEFHSLESPSRESVSAASKSYVMEIISADSLDSDSNSSVVLLSGNVVISFTLEGETVPKRLLAQKVIIDLERNLLSAQGLVSYEDASDSTIQSLEGSLVTLNWSKNTLLVTGATTSSEKTNSEDKKVTLYTSGEEISFHAEGGGVTYRNGWIGTRKEDPLSSIRAQQLSFLNGGDLMVKHATLSLGRVPVFYTPFFLFPGNRMVGNPSMGFASERGMFVTTTFELFGTYPKITSESTSSFASLLSSPESKQTFRDGPIHSDQGEVGEFERWARKSDSYLALMMDAYELSGVHLGYDTRLSWFEKRLVLEGFSSFALYPEGTKGSLTYSQAPTLRWMSEHTLKLDTSWADLTLDTPAYSDPKVKRLYANRLTSFSFDSVLGKSQEFPTTYLNDITSYTWKLEGSFSFPVANLSPYLTSARISSVTARSRWDWKEETPGGGYAYRLVSVTLPELSASLGGTLFSFSSPIAQNKSGQEGSTASTRTLETDALLPPAYPISQTQQTSGTKKMERSLSLTYSLDQKLNHTLQADGAQVDWEKDAYLYAQTKGSVLLSASPNSSLFTFSEELLPQYTRLDDQSKEAYRTEQFQLFSVTKASIPLLGFSYTLSQRIHRFQKTYTSQIVEQIDTYSFDADSVTVHQMKVEKTLPLGLGSLKPSLTANLYPIRQSLIPSLTYTQGRFVVGASLSYAETNGILKKERATANFSYTTKLFSFSTQETYDYTKSVQFWFQALSVNQKAQLSLFDSRLVISELLSYQGRSSKGIDHYIDQLNLDFKIPYLSVTYISDGQVGMLQPQRLKTTVSAKNVTMRWWNGRIALSLGLESTFNLHFQDIWATSLDVQASLGLEIAEFLSCSLSIKSSNTGFSQYYDSAQNFVWARMWEDLLRSFDFAGKGRSNTQFNLSSISFDLVHDLDDWSLNCKYTGSVVLSNNQYSWVPTVSVFVRWNTIPELDVEETWTKPSNDWIRSSTS